jgi:hypothetical protein
VLGVRGEQDRLDPVTGAEVEGTLAFAANGQVSESDGRAVHAGHMVGVGFRRARIIGRDQQLVVRDEARGPVHDLGVLDEKPGSREARPQLRAHELIEAQVCNGNAEQEESQKHG